MRVTNTKVIRTESFLEQYNTTMELREKSVIGLSMNWGVTVSIGISWNKIYAKLGSDYKKPDAITEFNRENYKSMIWQLPASDLLYVGRQTRKKLQKLGIRTIGQLAESDEKRLESHFGKIGNVLWAFANGWDEDPVCKEGYEAPVKSIGNSTTTPRDLVNDLDVWIIQMALAESVAARLRKHGFKCETVEITVRDNGLYSFSRQMHLRQPTNITDEIVTATFQLFKDNYKWEHPIRSLGIRVADLVLDDIPVQLDLFGNQEKKENEWHKTILEEATSRISEITFQITEMEKQITEAKEKCEEATEKETEVNEIAALHNFDKMQLSKIIEKVFIYGPGRMEIIWKMDDIFCQEEKTQTE